MRSNKAKTILNQSYHYDSATMTATVTFEVAVNAVRTAEAEMEEKAIEAFVAGCPLTPSKANFCGVAVCGLCDAAKNFIQKFTETNK